MKTTGKKKLVKTEAKAKDHDLAAMVELLGQILQELREVNERLQDLEYSRALLSTSDDDADEGDDSASGGTASEALQPH